MIHDFVQNVDALKADMRSFLVSPTRWRKSRVSIPLVWSYVTFNAVNRKHVPHSAGVYAFVVRHVNSHFPGHGFIMYVGITGANRNGRTLNDRYGDYLREQKRGKRPKVFYMLQKYPDDLHFAYCVTNPRIDLFSLERDLNDAIIPGVVVNDFTAEIRLQVKALT